MQNLEPNGKTSTGVTARPQFSLAALFWLLFALGLYFAYLRRFPPAAGLLGCLAIGQGLLTGAIVGLVLRRFVDSLYWSTLCAAFALVSVAGEASFDIVFRLAWCTVGAFSGALCAAVGRQRVIARLTTGAVVGGLVMAGFLLFSLDTTRYGGFDAVCAPVIGALIGLLITIVQRLELESYLPRHTIATWLLCAVLAGNLLTFYLGYSR